MPRRIYVVDDAGFNTTETMAMVIELLFGFFGWFGVGWLFVGNVPMAVGLMLGFWVLLAIETFLVTITAGCLTCLVIPLDIALLIYSAVEARSYAKRTKAKGHISYVISILVIITMILMCAGIAICGAGTGIIQGLPTPQPLPQFQFPN